MNCLDNLGYDLANAKRYDEAEPLLKEALRQGERFYKDRSPVADHALASLSRIAAGRHQWDKQLEYARQSYEAAKRVFDPGHRYYREGSAVFARVLIEQAERFCESEPQRAQALLDELTSNPDFTADVKASSGWLDCLRGIVSRNDATRRDEARAQITRGLDSLKKRPKPTAEDARRLQKAEGWLKALR